MKWLSLFFAFVGFSTLTLSAQTISDQNIFNTDSNAATITMNSTYQGFAPSGADDLGSSQSVFGDYMRSGGSDTNIDDQLMTISGFSASNGIGSLRFYDTDEYELGRDATQVTIYYSMSDTTSQVPGDFIALNGGNPFTLTLGSNGRYSSLSSASNANYGYYDTLTDLNIPTGAQSILLDFGPETYNTGSYTTGTYHVGVGFTEIQAFAPVPEPSTYVLMLGGVVALAGFVRFRRIPVQ